mmetsp:Transcript_23050/g.57729  ORF Transcript_23050/g.57729 Transcript_23050/m.57729 type:complete len:832 (-) Transcript_23050:130-2625(-)
MASNSGYNPTVCRYFLASGNCFYGDQCNYAHIRPDSGGGGFSSSAAPGPAPSTSSQSPTAAPAAFVPPKSLRPCRNIAIHGFCKFAGKGCEFNHDLHLKDEDGKGDGGEPAHSVSLPGLHKKPDPAGDSQYLLGSKMQNESYMNSAGVMSQPPYMGFSGGAQSYASYMQDPAKEKPTNVYARYGGYDAPSYGADQGSHFTGGGNMASHPSDYMGHTQFSSPYVSGMGQEQLLFSKTAAASKLYGMGIPPSYKPGMRAAPSAPDLHHSNALALHHERVNRERVHKPFSDVYGDNKAPGMMPDQMMSMGGGAQYFLPGQGQPANKSAQAGTKANFLGGLPHNALRHPGYVPLQTFFMSDNIRADLQRRNDCIWKSFEDVDEDAKKPPREPVAKVVHRFHTLYPLKEVSPEKQTTGGKVFPFPTSLYKCVSSTDGLPYVIRKVEGYRPSGDSAASYQNICSIWYQLQHPNIVTLREVFVSKELDDAKSLYFAYDYHPLSATLESKYFLSTGHHIPENVMWSYICQLVSAIHAMHSMQLVCRVVYPSKVIVTAKNRIRINGVGMLDVLSPEPTKSLAQLQGEDLIALGRLILGMACKSMAAATTLSRSLDYVSSQYSQDLKNLVLFLLGPSGLPYPSIDDVCSLITRPLLREVEYLHNFSDMLEGELSKELENGRLMRLMVKLGFINERPEFDMDQSWSETGDRYILKLFRDYVFHQVYEDGTPSLNWGHVIECLNKLDAGSPEKITLVSRDEQSVLVVSYHDIKRILKATLQELSEKQTSFLQGQMQAQLQAQVAQAQAAQQQFGSNFVPVPPYRHDQSMGMQGYMGSYPFLGK